jgi:RNA polymerase sigma factor (sigma-70 family)
MAQSDEELLRACRRGDEAAWEALVRRYQRLVYAVPRRAGLDEDAAADIFQDVFATLLENVGAIEQPSRLHAWLVTTARRKTWLAIKRARRTHSLDDEEGEGGETSSIPDEGLLPDEVLGQLEEQHLVRAALAELDERCRRLLTMLFYRADTPAYSEVAAALGTTEGSIGPTRARCLKKLLGALNEAGLFRPAVG